MKTAYINRNNANKEVFKRANDRITMERYQENFTREEQGRKRFRNQKKTEFWGTREKVIPRSSEYE